jgi:hypothetical protein
MSHRITSFNGKLGVDVMWLVGHGYTREHARRFGNHPRLAWVLIWVSKGGHGESKVHV